MNFDGPVVVIAAKGDNVCLGHSGRKIARKSGESKGLGFGPGALPHPGALSLTASPKQPTIFG
jgi:hypothetical protein